MLHRLRQVAASLSPRHETSVSAELTFTPRTARLFATLAAHDRRHLLAVHRTCIAEGLSLHVAMAGLLHDIGKASLSGQRLTLLDRSARVVLGRLGPHLLRRLSSSPAPAWRLGIVLAERHAEFGADRLAALGWPESTVMVVRDHEDVIGEGELATLRRIDDATV